MSEYVDWTVGTSGKPAGKPTFLRQALAKREKRSAAEKKRAREPQPLETIIQSGSKEVFFDEVLKFAKRRLYQAYDATEEGTISEIELGSLVSEAFLIPIKDKTRRREMRAVLKEHLSNRLENDVADKVETPDGRKFLKMQYGVAQSMRPPNFPYPPQHKFRPNDSPEIRALKRQNQQRYAEPGVRWSRLGMRLHFTDKGWVPERVPGVGVGGPRASAART
jgi:hypothetical protein